MDIKKYAEMLNGREYCYPLFTKEEIQIAKDNGFVIVYGYSDDLVEFEGAIDDEVGCFDGGKVYFDKNGASDEEEKPNMIEALWCDDEMIDTILWTFKTDIPHETFRLFDNGECYSIGIVFDIKDLKEKSMEDRKFTEEDFTEEELLLLRMAFKLVDTVVETQRTSNYDVHLCNVLYNLTMKLGVSDLIY